MNRYFPLLILLTTSILFCGCSQWHETVKSMTMDQEVAKARGVSPGFRYRGSGLEGNSAFF